MLSWNKDQWSGYIAVQARAIAIRQRFSIGVWYFLFFVNFLLVGLGTFFIDSKYEACKAAENGHAASNKKGSIKITTCVVQPAWITKDVRRHYLSFLHQKQKTGERVSVDLRSTTYHFSFLQQNINQITYIFSPWWKTRYSINIIETK